MQIKYWERIINKLDVIFCIYFGDKKKPKNINIYGMSLSNQHGKQKVFLTLYI